MVPLHLLGRLLLCYSAGGRKAFSLPGNSPTNERLSQLSQWTAIDSFFKREKSLPSFFISFIKSSSLHFCWELALGLPWLQSLNCSSLWILNKPIVAGEISGCLFTSGQQTQVWCLDHGPSCNLEGNTKKIIMVLALTLLICWILTFRLLPKREK